MGQYAEEERDDLLSILKIVNPWVFKMELKINAPNLRLDEICKYLTNIVNLRIKCSEGKNIEYKKKIVGMKFTEARDIS